MFYVLTFICHAAMCSSPSTYGLVFLDKQVCERYAEDVRKHDTFNGSMEPTCSAQDSIGPITPSRSPFVGEHFDKDGNITSGPAPIIFSR